MENRKPIVESPAFIALSKAIRQLIMSIEPGRDVRILLETQNRLSDIRQNYVESAIERYRNA